MSGPPRARGSELRRTIRRLFAYGTIAPRSLEELEGFGWKPAKIRGRLFDLGPFPALVDGNDPEAPWVFGFVRKVRPEELETIFDPYEGTAEGLFRREPTWTSRGVPCWVYVYNRRLPADARGPMAKWSGLAPEVSVLSRRLGIA